MCWAGQCFSASNTPTEDQPWEEQASFSVVLPLKTAFKPMQDFFFLHTGLCIFSCAQCSGVHIPGRKRGNKHVCFPQWFCCAPYGYTLHGSRAVSWTESQTSSAAHCRYSQALLLPSEHSTAQHPWLMHGTCSSPQNFLPYSKTRTGKCAGNSLHSLDSNRSTSNGSTHRQPLPALLSHWRAATGKFPCPSD